MNDCSISSQKPIRNSSGDITFSMLLLFLLDSKYITVDDKILFALSSDSSIEIHIK